MRLSIRHHDYPTQYHVDTAREKGGRYKQENRLQDIRTEVPIGCLGCRVCSRCVTNDLDYGVLDLITVMGRGKGESGLTNTADYEGNEEPRSTAVELKAVKSSDDCK